MKHGVGGISDQEVLDAIDRLSYMYNSYLGRDSFKGKVRYMLKDFDKLISEYEKESNDNLTNVFCVKCKVNDKTLNLENSDLIVQEWAVFSDLRKDIEIIVKDDVLEWYGKYSKRMYDRLAFVSFMDITWLKVVLENYLSREVGRFEIYDLLSEYYASNELEVSYDKEESLVICDWYMNKNKKVDN